MAYLIHNGELYHYGRKGMKWYQSVYGSLKKKAQSAKQKAVDQKTAREEAERKAAAEERAKKVAAGKIRSKDMTEEELRSRIARLDLEKQYNEARKNVNAHTRGKRFADKFSDTTVDRLADTVASDLFAQTVKAVLAKGVNEVSKKAGLSDEDVVFTNNKKK